jgi:multidrug efflux pump subunit AcrA (membrane-fusion protein)
MEQELASKSAKIEQADAQVQLARKSLDAAIANVDVAAAQIKDAAAGVDRAAAERQRWQAEYERGKRLMVGNVFDKQTVDEALNQLQASTAGQLQAHARLTFANAALVESEAKRKKADAEITAAEANAKVARADREQSAAWLDYRDIRAPYDGNVTQRNIHTGHFLQSSSSGSTNKSAEPLFTMMSRDIMRATVQVPENDASFVKVGAPAIVRFPGLQEKEITGTVTRFTRALDERARTLKVEIHLPNPHDLLLPGMYCNAEIRTELPNALVLPTDAVFTDGEKDYCFVIENGKAMKTPIKTGVRTNKVVQVLSKQARSTKSGEPGEWQDFTGKEEVVAANPESLTDGQTAMVASTK